MPPLDDAIKSLVSSTAEVGPRLFETLALELARVLDVRFAMVSEVVEKDPEGASTLAFVDGTEAGPAFRYPLCGAPCEEVIRRAAPLSVLSQLTREFPADVELRSIGAEAYIGHPLLDAGGHCVGVLAVLHDRPIEDAEAAQTLLRLFAPRVEAEVQRRRSDRRAAESRRFEVLLKDLASRFLRAPLDELLLEVDTGARILLATTGLDRARLIEVGPGGAIEDWCCCSREGPSSRCSEQTSRLPPWVRDELLAGRNVLLGGPEALGQEASGEGRFFEGLPHSVFGVPFTTGGVVFGALLLGAEGKNTAWSEETVRQLSLAAEIFGHALARHRRERALEESEENYRNLLELAPGAILVHSDGIVRFANQAACRMRGVADPSGLVGRPVIDLVHPRDRAMALDRVRRVMVEGTVPPVDELLVREDGTTVEAVVATVATTWEGHPAVQVVASDISALRRAERALASSDARYRALFEQAAVGIADFDLEGRFVRVNERYSEITGREGSALVGRPGASVVHPDDLDRARGEMADILADRQARTTFEWRCVRPDGKAAWIRSDVSVVRGEDGKPAHLMAVVADMTASHAAEHVAQAAVAEIQERMEEWSTTVDALPLGLVVLDPACRVLRANRIAKGLADEGRVHPGAEHWSVADLVPREPWTAIVSLASAQDDAPAPEEVVDGMGRTWLVSLARTTLSDEGGKRAIVTFADVTDNTRLKERLDRSERLALMGSLMSGVAHEVRNPLFAISANADALELELGEREDVSEMLEALQEGVARLRRVLEDLLDFGRSAPAPPATGALDVAVFRALRACDELVRAGSIAVECRVPAGLVVGVDERRLARALESVISNALVWARGRVEVRAQSNLEENVGAVLVSVRDDGPGFERQDFDRVFEPFFSRRRGTTGLGLTIAQRILDQYRGSISVANHHEGGGLVTLNIPLAAVAPSS